MYNKINSKVLVIYDKSGVIWGGGFLDIDTESDERFPPDGIPYMIVEPPEGAVGISRIDVSDPNNHKPVYIGDVVDDSTNFPKLEDLLKVCQNNPSMFDFYIS